MKHDKLKLSFVMKCMPQMIHLSLDLDFAILLFDYVVPLELASLKD